MVTTLTKADLIRKYLRAGIDPSTTAHLVCSGTDYVYRIASKENIPTKPLPSSRHTLGGRAASDLYDVFSTVLLLNGSGFSDTEIAKLLQVHRQSVSRTITRHYDAFGRERPYNAHSFAASRASRRRGKVQGN